MKFFKRKSKDKSTENVESKDANAESTDPGAESVEAEGTEAAGAGASGGGGTGASGGGGAGASGGAGAGASGGGGAGASGGGGPATPPPKKAGGGMTPKRIVFGVVGVLLLLWIVGTVIGFFEPSKTSHVARNENIADFEDADSTMPDRHDAVETHDTGAATGEHSAGSAKSTTSRRATGDSHGSASHSTAASSSRTDRGNSASRSTGSASGSHGDNDKSHSAEKAASDSSRAPASHGDTNADKTTSRAPAATGAHGATGTAEHGAVSDIPRRPGIAVTEAILAPLAYELDERWWGWRPNDLVNITDNVNNFQLGVLEVTRRATVALAERLSRTGSTASYDLNLERAMNWFMVKAEAYWFPSAESKYREGLDELRAYKNRLESGQGQFFTRPDNLIPLIASFEDLLGSCDENLVKSKEDGDKDVSFTKADDYFYYAQGVATSMLGILEAVHEDFHATLETRRSAEILHHAILSCEHASEIRPWLIMESDLDSIFSNHRANLAAPISHARFYLGLLIKALST